jgi:DNA-directed RNA polymerase specialized sigma24 family protein
MTRHEKDAEDLVQDALLRAYRFFDTFEAGTNCKAWLFRSSPTSSATATASASASRRS